MLDRLKRFPNKIHQNILKNILPYSQTSVPSTFKAKIIQWQKSITEKLSIKAIFIIVGLTREGFISSIIYFALFCPAKPAKTILRQRNCLNLSKNN